MTYSKLLKQKRKRLDEIHPTGSHFHDAHVYMDIILFRGSACTHGLQFCCPHLLKCIFGLELPSGASRVLSLSQHYQPWSRRLSVFFPFDGLLFVLPFLVTFYFGRFS